VTLTNRAAEATAIGLRHDHVPNNEIDGWVAPLDKAQRLECIRRLHRDVPSIPEDSSGQLEHRRVIVHDQDAPRCGVGACRAVGADGVPDSSI
jgi:hypothetical protein